MSIAIQRYAVNGDQQAYEKTLRKMSVNGKSLATATLAKFLCLRRGLCDEAISILIPLADSGDVEAQYNVGGMLLTRGDNKGVAYIKKAAEKGYQKAISRIEEMETFSALKPPITTSKVLGLLKINLTRKVNQFTPETLRCYKKTAPELIAINERNFPTCLNKVVVKYGDTEDAVRYKSREVALMFSDCMNSEEFAEISITANELAACLPK